MQKIAVELGALIIIGIILRIIFDHFRVRIRKGKLSYNYLKKDYLMTPAEQELFNVLLGLYGEKYFIFPQVHLSSIFEHKITGQNWRGAFRHIDEKSVDFVLCDKRGVRIILAIECDDKTHNEPDRVERDRIVNDIFKQAKLPLVRISNLGHFEENTISSFINPFI